MHGQGALTLAQHNACDPHIPGCDVYTGSFRDNLAEGRGVFRYANKDVYTGE